MPNPRGSGARVDVKLLASTIDTPLGEMVAVADSERLHLLEFADRPILQAEIARLEQLESTVIGQGPTAIATKLAGELDAYFQAKRGEFSIPLAYHGRPFAQSVWHALETIPCGQTMNYGALAAKIGRPTASRAVARANGANQIAIIIPCHRVIGTNGSLTGYGGGLWRKRELLEIERQFAGLSLFAAAR